MNDRTDRVLVRSSVRLEPRQDNSKVDELTGLSWFQSGFATSYQRIGIISSKVPAVG